MNFQDENAEPSQVSSKIKLLCDRFEAAWKTGTPPDLATYLLEIEKTSRPLALRELLRVELEMRRARGESPTLDEYQRQFSDHAALLAEAFKSADRRELDTLAMPHAHATTGFHVRCPHCHNPIELVPEANLSDIECKSCGGSFSLTGSEKVDPQAHGTRIGHFELIERLGMGAFGAVWRALDTKLDRTVAIKIPRKGQLNAAETEMFLREARSAAQLRHPNIVSVHEVGRDNDAIYLVSDLIQGLSLDKWFSEQRLSSREAAVICSKIADALQHAHERGVIHRDLKPQNVLMDGAGEPHLTDFGLAKREAGEITMTMEGQLLGTPAYMSPEQARGESHVADGRTDVYSLGVVLFQLLTSELPFRGNVRMLLKQVLEDDAPAPRQLDNRVPRDLDTICQKCLAKEPSRRYRTAHELAVELRRFLANEPISARPIARHERTWRWCRRNPVVAALTATLVACLVMGIAVSSYFAIEASNRALAEGVQRLRVENEKKETARQLTRARHSLFTAQLLRVASLGSENHELGIRLLEDTAACPIDLRDFSWHMYFRQFKADHASSSLEEATFKVGEPVRSVAITRDGKILAVGTMAHIDNPRAMPKGTPADIQLFDVATREKLGTLRGHTDIISSVAFAPDGKMLVSAGADNVVRFWNVTSRTEVEKIKAAAFCLAFSPDGKTLATGEFGEVRLWDAATRELRATFKGRFAANLSIAFAPDSDVLAAADAGVNGQPGEVTLWRLTGKKLHTLKGHVGYVQSIVFSPDGQTLVSAGDEGLDLSSPKMGSRRGSIRFWDLDSGKERIAIRLEGNARSLTYSSDGRTLAGGIDLKSITSQRGKVNAAPSGEIKLWDPETGQLRMTLTGHSDGVESIAFATDGEKLISGSRDGTVMLWQGAAPPWRALLGEHSGVVNCVAFAPNGKVLASGSAQYNHRTLADIAGEIKVWDVASGQEQAVLIGHAREVQSLAFMADNRTLASGSADKTIKLWDSMTGQEQVTLNGHSQGINCLAFQPKGQLLASAGGEELKLWDMTTRKEVASLKGHTGAITSIEFAPDGATLVTASRDQTIRRWDVATGTESTKFTGHSCPITSLAIAPDGMTLASRCSDEIILWDIVTGKVQSKISFSLPPSDSGPEGAILLAFSRDSKALAFGKLDAVRVWDVAMGREIPRKMEPILPADANQIKSFAVARDCQTVASGHQGLIFTGAGHVKLWDAPKFGL